MPNFIALILCNKLSLTFAKLWRKQYFWSSLKCFSNNWLIRQWLFLLCKDEKLLLNDAFSIKKKITWFVPYSLSLQWKCLLSVHYNYYKLIFYLPLSPPIHLYQRFYNIHYCYTITLVYVINQLIIVLLIVTMQRKMK